jgi:GR25 family glycosyltransferase involved in LPS biosynthesis
MRLSDFNIVYINLKKRPKKREYIENELDKVGLLKQSTWINGIDGSTLSKNIQNHYLNNFKTMAKKKDRIIGRIGCFLSHKLALHAAIKAGLDNILILEDDCKFLIERDIELPDPPKDAEIIYFGGLFWNQKPETKAMIKRNSKLDWIQIDRTHLKIACALSYAIIGKENIKKVFDKISSPRPSAIDILYINYVQKIQKTQDKRQFLPSQCYIINPVICIQDHKFPSDVTFKGATNPDNPYKNSYFYFSYKMDWLTFKQ